MSNLLEKASIVTTPTAYENGKILSVKPAPSLGSELVVNGDFENGSANWSTNDWVIANGIATATNIANSLNQSLSVTLGATYSVSINVLYSDDVLGLRVKIGGVFSDYLQEGLHTLLITTTGTQSLQIVPRSSNSTYSIDNVSVKQAIDGDFDFTRNSSATRVNSQGLIEDVQILSGNLVSNGDFSQEGSEQITNGDFSNGTTSWSFTSGATLTALGAKITHTPTAGSVSQPSVLTIGKSYKLTYEITESVSGGLKFNSAVNASMVTTVGVHTKYLEADATAASFSRTNSSNNDVTITNISVKEVGQDWNLGTGWSIGNNKAIANNVPNLQRLQRAGNNPSVIGNTYKYSINISNVSGFYSVYIFGVYVLATSNTEGIIEGEFTATSTNGAFWVAGASASGLISATIENITILEITEDTNLPRINYEGFSYQNVLGSELVVNGGFDTDSNWSKDANWSILNGVATSNGAGLIQQSTSELTPGKTYKISFEITEYTSGGVKLYSGSGSDASTYKNTVGTHTDTLVLNGNTTSLYSNNFIGSIDNVSVKEYLGQEVVPDSGRGHWLFEPQSTNLIPNANQYAGNTVYYTVTPNQSSPDGENNATLFVEKTSTSPYSVNSINASIIGGQTYTYSFFVKYAGKQNIPVNATDGVSGFNANIDILNGTVNSGTAEVKDFGNGWFRVLMTRTVNASASNGSIQLNFGNQTGDGTSGFYLFGYQIEQQSFATSYIPTNGEVNGVTRLADAAFGAGSSDLINSTEGVLYAEIAALSENYTGRRFITLNDATASNGVVLRYEASGVIVARYQIGGIAQCSIAFAATITNYHKIAFKYSLNDFALWVDGVEVGVDSSGSVLSENVLNNIDFNSGNGTFPFYGKTKCVAVFKEALTDAELTCLTTI